jgi:hypothetical protein
MPNAGAGNPPKQDGDFADANTRHIGEAARVATSFERFETKRDFLRAKSKSCFRFRIDLRMAHGTDLFHHSH